MVVSARMRGRKRKQHVDEELLVNYFIKNGPPPPRASTEPGGYWCKVASAVSLSAKPSHNLVKAVAAGPGTAIGMVFKTLITLFHLQPLLILQKRELELHCVCIVWSG